MKTDMLCLMTKMHGTLCLASFTNKHKLILCAHLEVLEKKHLPACFLLIAPTALSAESRSKKRTNATPLLSRVFLSLTIVTLNIHRGIMLGHQPSSSS